MKTRSFLLSLAAATTGCLILAASPALAGNGPGGGFRGPGPMFAEAAPDKMPCPMMQGAGFGERDPGMSRGMGPRHRNQGWDRPFGRGHGPHHGRHGHGFGWHNTNPHHPTRPGFSGGSFSGPGFGFFFHEGFKAAALADGKVDTQEAHAFFERKLEMMDRGGIKVGNVEQNQDGDIVVSLTDEKGSSLRTIVMDPETGDRRRFR